VLGSASGAGGLGSASGAGGLGSAPRAGGPDAAAGRGGAGSSVEAPWPAARTFAAAAALALAVSGRGDLLLLGGLLAIALGRRRSAVTALVAVVAVAVRWGGTSAEAITGTITTLGPGVRLGPPLAALALGLAAAALVLAALATPLLPRLAAVVSAVTFAIGPVAAGTAGAVVLGLLGVVLAGFVALVLPRLVPEPSERLRGAAPVTAALALALAVVW
jgi:hypothetical protein